jgi:hypothetical protein
MKVLKYLAVLAGIVIVVNHYTGAGTLVTDTFNGASSLDKTVQGR